MKIKIVSIPVLDQQKALDFYTEKLGFVKRHDIDLGNGHRWLTVYSPEDPKGAELLLEPAPLSFEPSKVYQQAIFDKGMPWTQFDVDDCQKEYDELVKKGVEFTMKPTDAGTVVFAILNDTVGNLIQLVQNK